MNAIGQGQVLWEVQKDGEGPFWICGYADADSPRPHAKAFRQAKALYEGGLTGPRAGRVHVFVSRYGNPASRQFAGYIMPDGSFRSPDGGYRSWTQQ